MTVVSDNGTCFASSEFKDFLTSVGVRYHKFTAPYHPATNGQAERSVQTVKRALKSLGANKSNLQKHLNLFLRQYRIAPHSTTGKPPASLFLGRVIRTRLDLILPQDLTTKMTDKQYMQFNPVFRSFEPMQNVYFLSNNIRMNKWLPGVILNRLGDLHYEILYEGKHVKRHIDQIRVGNNSKEKQNFVKPQQIERSNAKNIEHRRQSHIDFNNSHSSSQSCTDYTVEGPPNVISTPQRHSPTSNASPTAIYSTPQSSFKGFNSSGEDNECVYFDESENHQNEINTGSDPDNSETEPDISNRGDTVPLRKSTRVRKPRIIFSP